MARKGIERPDKVADIQSSVVSHAGKPVSLYKYKEQRIIQVNSPIAAFENQTVLEVPGFTGEVEDA
jgi:hypothetical protein